MNETTKEMIDDYVDYLMNYEPNEYEAMMKEQAELDKEWMEFNSRN